MIPVTMTVYLPEPDKPYCNGSDYKCKFLRTLLYRDHDWCNLFGCGLKEEVIIGDGSESYTGERLPVSRKVRCAKCKEISGQGGYMETIKCIECGNNACVCQDDDKWAAHCMTCDNSIGKRGYYHAVADSEAEAIRLWNDLNKEE